ncbi:O-antigen ligase family protein [Alcanivorax quisquiliarum]|uniref:Uncharacterized protein n=1 Tax=Alcanivorax quisquiliarum TaxID=2933565 RepID=A0ABT0E2Q5_9GAMM|nr:hypothetical protein [Alcanivorax quisquiliarum]MCK0536102.1 hypothetical protein [Alcanivorax quisquiliarum]
MEGFEERSRGSLFFAISLLLCLPTNFRFSESVGFGELGLLLCILLFFFRYFSLKHRRRGMRAAASMPMALLCYLIFVLLPVTFFNSLYENGALFRDYLAFLFCGLVILSCALYGLDVRKSMRIFCSLLLVYLVATYFFGGDAFWYSVRFTGGAKNPNQLALYIVCAVFAAVISYDSKAARYFFGFTLGLIGLATVSDAYYLFLGVIFSCYAAVALFPYRFFFLTFPIVLLLLMSAIFLFFPDSSEYISEVWETADEGGSRVSLYLHGLMAWLNDFYTFILGNGAGAFSGAYMPYEGAEAHNTPIDMLSIGGCVAFVLFYSYFFYIVWSYYKLGRKMEVSILIGIFVFSFFHFVLRHPVFWVAIYLAGLNLTVYLKRSRDLCVE